MKLDELHNRFFELLCIIDDICKKNNLKYYLAGGTELGAVRDGDFIPWDDDMDLKIMMEDYEKFSKVMREQLPEHLHFIGPEDFCPKFFGFHAHIYDDRYTIRKEKEHDRYYNNVINRVSTDVFCVCKVPKGEFARKVFKIKNKVLWILGAGHKYGRIYKDDMPSYKRKVIDLLRNIGKKIPAKRTVDKWYKHVRKYNDMDNYGYRFACNYTFKSMIFFEKELFDMPDATAKIRGREFPVIGGYDRELSKKYGDYMTPKRDDNYYIQHLDVEDRYVEADSKDAE